MHHFNMLLPLFVVSIIIIIIPELVYSGGSRWVSGVSTETPFKSLRNLSVYSLYLMFMDSAT